MVSLASLRLSASACQFSSDNIALTLDVLLYLHSVNRLVNNLSSLPNALIYKDQFITYIIST